MRTKTKKEQVTHELADVQYIVGATLADVPLGAVTPATMHVILGLTKKEHEWPLKMYSKLEALEEEKTAGRTTDQFRQSIVETKDKTSEYCAFLKRQ